MAAIWHVARGAAREPDGDTSERHIALETVLLLMERRIVDRLLQHPIPLNRPIVVTPLGTRLRRPSETVLDLLPQP